VLDGGRDDGDEVRLAKLALRGCAGEVALGASMKKRGLRGAQRPLAGREPDLEDPALVFALGLATWKG
jgi:hypothetical protein